MHAAETVVPHNRNAIAFAKVLRFDAFAVTLDLQSKLSLMIAPPHLDRQAQTPVDLSLSRRKLRSYPRGSCYPQR